VNILTAPWCRVGDKSGCRDTLTHRRTDHDDAAAALHVLQSRLGRDVHATDVDVDHAIHLFQRGLRERFGNGRAGIVHQHVESAEGGDCLFDAFFTASASAASAWIAIALPPSRWIAFTTDAAASDPFEYVMATLAPSLARRLAIAAPMPREPPVTSHCFIA